MKKNTIKVVKAWAVIWSEIGKKLCGLRKNEIWQYEFWNEEDEMVNEPLCIFMKKSEAIKFIKGNEDIEVIPVLITPIKKVVKNKVGK